MRPTVTVGETGDYGFGWGDCEVGECYAGLYCKERDCDDGELPGVTNADMDCATVGGLDDYCYDDTWPLKECEN